MSKLIDNVAAEITGHRRPVLSPYDIVPSITTELTEVVFLDQYEYSVRASFGVTGSCRKDQLGLVKTSFMDRLRHEIYGDLVRMLHTLETHVRSGDIDAACQVMTDIRKEVQGR